MLCLPLRGAWALKLQVCDQRTVPSQGLTSGQPAAFGHKQRGGWGGGGAVSFPTPAGRLEELGPEGAQGVRNTTPLLDGGVGELQLFRPGRMKWGGRVGLWPKAVCCLRTARPVSEEICKVGPAPAGWGSGHPGRCSHRLLAEDGLWAGQRLNVAGTKAVEGCLLC